MGHIRLGKLPRTRKWKHVTGLLEIGSDVFTVADASLPAAKIGLAGAADDPGFLHTLTSIFRFLESSGSKEIDANLNREGYSQPDKAPLQFYLHPSGLPLYRGLSSEGRQPAQLPFIATAEVFSL
jgi:hypothetical protein